MRRSEASDWLVKVAIMQPYLFPYIGYFQLISAADTFVIYDDAAFMKQSFINRNEILVAGVAKRISFPIANASSFRPINDHYIPASPLKVLRTIEQAYAKAPYHQVVMDLVSGVFSDGELNIAVLAERSLRATCEYLGIERTFVRSSALEYSREDASATEKVLAMCSTLGAKSYINNLGGQGLYASSDFDAVGIDLGFLKPEVSEYKQSAGQFVGPLSVIDMLMFVAPDEVRKMAGQGEVISAHSIEAAPQ